MFYKTWSDWECTSFMKLYTWFSTYIVNSTSHNSLLGNIANKPSVQLEDGAICNAEGEQGEEINLDELDDVEEAVVTYLNEVDLENTLSGPGQEDCALLTLHEREIEKAILSEDVLDKYTKVSCSDHASCVKCKILNERNHITEADRYQKMWDATTLVPLEDGTHRVKVDYQFRASPGEMFPVGNYKAALKNAMHVSRKAERDGLSEVL